MKKIQINHNHILFVISFQTALVSEMDASLPDGTKKANILRISPAEGADHMVSYVFFLQLNVNQNFETNQCNEGEPADSCTFWDRWNQIVMIQLKIDNDSKNK